MTSHIVEIDEQLKPETQLYRTLDFYGAASIVKERQLMFTRADNFDDRNEGVDRLLGQLETRSLNGMGWNDLESARLHHERFKRSHYISCWTTRRESVAMWSLYSPDHCSVRVETTVADLAATLTQLAEKYSVTRVSSEKLNQLVTVATHARMQKVLYRPLVTLSDRIQRRVRAYRKIKAQQKPRETLAEIFSAANLRYFQREEKRRIFLQRSPFLFKDESFQHEEEVRLVVKIGETVWTKELQEEQTCFSPGHEYFDAAKMSLTFWGEVRSTPLPSREYASCGNLVKSVAIDPRCPPHKAKFMRQWFLENGIPVAESTCFGYLPSRFEEFPES
ncbi:DUF2971 domain-containing protein [Massilia agri]|uniref:DUF2971 domain-containing protein n=1 Tax=Massilia agri TaxID=1886785 RepID=A0ABT2ANS3_9BURK|nr:DUF2971 domain-containing protein [Massilia agri]MCS0597893.1 hypothetical protein [Massilia agri]